MKSKLIGKLLSFTLSAALAVTAFSTPAYAAETDLGQAEEIAFEEVVEEESLEDAVDNTDETFEETTEAEETEEVSFEEELVEDIDEVEEQAEEATTEAEEVFAVEEEDADFEAVSSNNSNTITVIFHSNYRGNDTTVKRFFDKTNLDENPINYTSLFTVGAKSSDSTSFHSTSSVVSPSLSLPFEYFTVMLSPKSLFSKSE